MISELCKDIHCKYPVLMNTYLWENSLEKEKWDDITTEMSIYSYGRSNSMEWSTEINGDISGANYEISIYMATTSGSENVTIEILADNGSGTPEI